jgi:hypothetical protein
VLRLVDLISANVAVFVAQLCIEFYQPGFVREYLGGCAAG